MLRFLYIFKDLFDWLMFVSFGFILGQYVDKSPILQLVAEVVIGIGLLIRAILIVKDDYEKYKSKKEN